MYRVIGVIIFIFSREKNKLETTDYMGDLILSIMGTSLAIVYKILT